MSDLIWIHTVCNSDGIPEIVTLKIDYERNSANNKKHAKFPSIQRVINAQMSCGMGSPAMWFVGPAKPQISLRIRAV